MPMKVTDGTPPTQRWVPQAEPLDLNEPIGLLCDPNEGDRPLDIHVEDLDRSVQHRIESWPEAVELWQMATAHLRRAANMMSQSKDADLRDEAIRIHQWLTANAPEEST